MKFSALLFSCLFFLFSYFLFLPSTIFAQSATPAATNTNPDVPPRNPVTTGNVVGTFQPQADYVPNNLHNWTQNVMIEVMSALTCQLAGVDPINPRQGCLGIDSKNGKIGFLERSPAPNGGGAIGFMGDMIATLYTPPLHTGDYFQNLAQNFGINKKAYAQNAGLPAEASAKAGTGFQGLTPLIGIWSAFRNIVYLFLVIVFIVIGLAIMLRVKIDPRTVMTIQNQIPKIIIGILVVTFSFAIAGFLVDLMWVFIYLIFGIFSGISPEVAKSVSGLNPTLLQGKSVLDGAMGMGDINSLSANVAANGSNIIKKMLGIGPTFGELNPFNFEPGNIINVSQGGSFLSGILKVAGFYPNLNPINWLISITSTIVPLLIGIKLLSFPPLQAFGNSLGWITNIPATLPIMGGTYVATNIFLREALPFIIIYLIIFIALLVALFRLWFTLIMAYVHILLDVVLAPFWIIGGIIPGSPISLSGWLRDISANLLAFPATIGMFMLGKVFMDAFAKTPASGQNFVPPLIGNAGEPSLIGSLIGLGIILMTPNVVNMLKTALKAPKLDTGLGKAIGAGIALPVNVGKNIGGSLLGSQEAVMRKGPTGTYDWGERGIPRTIFGRFFGR